MSDLDKIAPCPSSPNCVSTLADREDRRHHMQPVPFSAAPGRVMAAIVAALEQHGAEITERGDLHVRAVCTTRLLRFKDDVTFVVCPADGMVHHRSASRLGWSDWGKNRSRMHELLATIKTGLA